MGVFHIKAVLCSPENVLAFDFGFEVDDELLISTRRIGNGGIPVGMGGQTAAEQLSIVRWLRVDGELGDAVVAQRRRLARDALSLSKLEKGKDNISFNSVTVNEDL